MIRFLVFGDVHYDHLPDGNRRVQELMEAIREEKPDFALSLGDLCSPTPQNLSVRSVLESTGCPVYYVLGNHEGDHHDLQTAITFFGLSGCWYSFIVRDVKFIVLYAGFMKQGETILPYQKSLYDKTVDLYPIIPDEELNWLRNEMADDKLKYVICSHQSLVNEFPHRGIVNREEVRSVLQTRNTLLCLNGHDHGNAQAVLHGIPYVTLNSAAYFWHGMQMPQSVSSQICAQYPILKDVLVIENALYGMMEEKEIRIRGRKSRWQSLTPEQIGAPARWNGVSVAPTIPDYDFVIQ